MYKYIWLVPLLPLAGAALNGIFGRWFRFPEKLIGGIAVGSVALSFLISLTAVFSFGFFCCSPFAHSFITTQNPVYLVSPRAAQQTIWPAANLQNISLTIQQS